jgi:hypothetical protein
MVDRKGYFSHDAYFDEYCTTRCPRYKDVWIGSLDCKKCKDYISEVNGDGSSVVIRCKN